MIRLDYFLLEVSIQITRLKEDILVQQNLLNELENVSVLFRNESSKILQEEQLDQMKKQYESTDVETLNKAEQKFKSAL